MSDDDRLQRLEREQMELHGRLERLRGVVEQALKEMERFLQMITEFRADMQRLREVDLPEIRQEAAVAKSLRGQTSAMRVALIGGLSGAAPAALYLFAKWLEGRG